MRFVDRFKAVIFDMNGTFMFGADRLDAEQDFYSTYRNVGGVRLGREALHAAVLRVCDAMQKDYKNPCLSDSFPSLKEAVEQHGNVESSEAVHIEHVIAAHEVGHVPTWAAGTLKALSVTHDIAVVSNVWARAHHWNFELSRSGVAEVCTCMIFSSEVRSIKPSPRPFIEALGRLSLGPSEVLFVGDSLYRDINPAKALGMATAWVSSSRRDHAASIRIKAIPELL